MNKKMLILGLSLLLSIAIVYAIIEFDEETMIPQNEPVIDGNNETLFQVEIFESGIDYGGVTIDDKWHYTINCFDTTFGATCNISLDLEEYTEREYEYYFWVIKDLYRYESSILYFTIDRIPSAPTVLSAQSLNETALLLDWKNNTELDISNYTVYISSSAGINISNPETFNEIDVTASEYVLGGLSMGNVRFFRIVARDNGGKESLPSIEINATVKDATPPIQPVITPNNSSIVNTTNPTIVFDYTANTENVTLKIMNNGIWKTFNGNNSYVWEPTFIDNTTYPFTLNSIDDNGNTRSDTYVISVRTGALFNIEIKGVEHATYNFFPVKTSIFAGDYVLFGVHANFYTFTGNKLDRYIRFKMDEWEGSSHISIRKMGAIAFCGEDYNADEQNIVSDPVKNVYHISDEYDTTDNNALNCTDTEPYSDVEFTFYVRANIPPDAKPGTYTFEYGIRTYPEED